MCLELPSSWSCRWDGVVTSVGKQDRVGVCSMAALFLQDEMAVSLPNCRLKEIELVNFLLRIFFFTMINF